MTIKEYINDLEKINAKFTSKNNGPSLKDTMLSQARVWSNEAAKGYALQAMQNAGLKENQIHKVLLEMSYAFNDFSVEEAEENYINNF